MTSFLKDFQLTRGRTPLSSQIKGKAQLVVMRILEPI